jgi:hypothetical protein
MGTEDAEMTEPSRTPRTIAALEQLAKDMQPIRRDPAKCYELTLDRLGRLCRELEVCISEESGRRERVRGLLREMKKAMLGYPMSTRAMSPTTLLSAINSELKEEAEAPK